MERKNRDRQRIIISERKNIPKTLNQISNKFGSLYLISGLVSLEAALGVS